MADERVFFLTCGKRSLGSGFFLLFFFFFSFSHRSRQRKRRKANVNIFYLGYLHFDYSQRKLIDKMTLGKAEKEV
jgi:hypothetical protein